MGKKRKSIVIALCVLLVMVLIYWFYFSPPVPFPTNEQLAKDMNRVFPEAAVSSIQDTIVVDDRHVVVPFISDTNDYGLSYWVWQKRKWQVGMIDTNGDPIIWITDRNDLSSYQFVWNIHPEDQLGSMEFYLIRDRGYQISGETEFYSPKVQMKKNIFLDEKSYGVMSLPKDWATFMNSIKKVESANQSGLFVNDFYSVQNMYFGWISYNQSGKETYPEHSGNGSGYGNGLVDREFLRTLDHDELEWPE